MSGLSSIEAFPSFPLTDGLAGGAMGIGSELLALGFGAALLGWSLAKLGGRGLGTMGLPCSSWYASRFLSGGAGGVGT